MAFIVEDNEMFSTMLDHTLSNESVCRFVNFKSGEECINNLYMNPLMVILDYGLPGMDGLKTFRVMKKYNPEIPVVVLTGKNDEKVAREFFNEGAYAYLVKQKSTVPQIIKIINDLLYNGIGKKHTAKNDSNKKIYKNLAIILLLVGLAMGMFYFLHSG